MSAQAWRFVFVSPWACLPRAALLDCCSPATTPSLSHFSLSSPWQVGLFLVIVLHYLDFCGPSRPLGLQASGSGAASAILSRAQPCPSPDHWLPVLRFAAVGPWSFDREPCWRCRWQMCPAAAAQSCLGIRGAACLSRELLPRTSSWVAESDSGHRGLVSLCLSATLPACRPWLACLSACLPKAGEPARC